MSRWRNAQSVGRTLVKVAKVGMRAYESSQAKQRRSPADDSAAGPTGSTTPAPRPPRRRTSSDTAYRGDHTGRVEITYAPHPDGDADPGEVVWAWVPYEDDPSQGKDRPVLVIAMSGGDLLGLMLTSKDHVGAGQQDRGDGRHWFDLGTGDWDSQRRPSEIRLDRVLRLAPSAVRREGATLERARFDQVAAAAREANDW